MDDHMSTWVAENGYSGQDASWDNWTRAVESMFGHGLDGDQNANGFSFDFAHDAWEDGVTPQSYVDSVLKSGNYNPTKN